MTNEEAAKKISSYIAIEGEALSPEDFEAFKMAIAALATPFPKKGRTMTDLYIRDKYHGTVHRIGDDQHDCLTVDKEGTIHYLNLQCDDGCIGFKSVNRETLKDVHPEIDWGKRANEFKYGYEFVPNEDEYGFPFDPREGGKQ